MCDSKGIISPDRNDLNPFKQSMLEFSNAAGISGSFRDALKGADVFVGVSVANLLTEEDVQSMAPGPVILAMANPIPEIMPDKARAAGAAVIGTGRSDFPNQVNNVPRVSRYFPWRAQCTGHPHHRVHENGRRACFGERR